MTIHTRGASALIPFRFRSNQIRAIEKYGEPWFIATDIAAALDYRDAANMARMLDEDETGYSNVSTPGGEQRVVIINESGLYHAIFKSTKPDAKPFRTWITAEVLPAIRKTGSYSRQQAPVLPINNQPRTRYLVRFDDDGQSYHATVIDPGACIMTPAQFAKAVGDPSGFSIDDATLLKLIEASTKRLQGRAYTRPEPTCRRLTAPRDLGAQIVAKLQAAGPQGMANRDLAQAIHGYKHLDDAARAALIDDLLQAGKIIELPRSGLQRARRFGLPEVTHA